MDLVNEILNAGIFAGPEPSRDSWSLGTVSGEPAAGLVDVVLDGDVTATGMPYMCPCHDDDRVLTILLGRSRIAVGNLAEPAALLLSVLLGVDGAGSGLDADKLDGQEGSYYAAETTTTTGALINGATAKTTPIDADYVGLMDSAASNVLKKLSWANIKATLKTYFDTLYSGTVTKHGTVTLGTADWTDVNFAAAFAGTPRVTLTPNTATAGVIAPKTKDVDSTGFSATIGGTGFSDITCDWIAVY